MTANTSRTYSIAHSHSAQKNIASSYLCPSRFHFLCFLQKIRCNSKLIQQKLENPPEPRHGFILGRLHLYGNCFSGKMCSIHWSSSIKSGLVLHVLKEYVDVYLFFIIAFVLLMYMQSILPICEFCLCGFNQLPIENLWKITCICIKHIQTILSYHYSLNKIVQQLFTRSLHCIQ
jgi:hypothetical protein